MTDDLRTRIAALVLDVLNETKAESLRWRLSASGIIANRLIAAGATMPAPQSDMPDDLRTRLIAVIDAQQVSTYDGGIHPEDVVQLAVAVIRELGRS